MPTTPRGDMAPENTAAAASDDARRPEPSQRRQAVARISAAPATPRRAQTQRLLLDAGRELFVSQGILGTSIGDLCARAGFTRGAFYSNFTDKDHFVQVLAADHWERVIEAAESALDAASQDAGALGSEDEALEGLSRLWGLFEESLPLTRDFYLLISEFDLYAARLEGEASTRLRRGMDSLKSRVTLLLDRELHRLGRRCLLPLEDLTAAIMGIADQSMLDGLSCDDGDLAGLLERTLPLVLVRLSTPIGPDPVAED
ncbi:TetR/AcrR family transcriptional regulator [Actinomyces sp. B33]|uniref:TetR/AcrR family transcriptional regulator n=1 Tax=Actinomyces sp. B33 TaxID=2942131 RepID=UPI002340BEE6|nr:TetR/AcrR family transcriptional regulator [Actinomyces sp. B33]MDC4233142.1 TetR/AcrR family transcriptional regulator [Actinomyces sp. B33]